MTFSRSVAAWAQDEMKARAEKRKQETIAKIKELGVAGAISGARGRPARAKPAKRV